MNPRDVALPGRYAAQVAITGVANGALSAVSAAVALPLLVATLGLEAYGRWALLGLFLTTAAALDLGLSRALVLLAAGQSTERVRQCATAAALLAAALALGATLLIASLSLATGRFLGLAATVDPALLAGGCALLTVSMMNGVLRAVLESQMAVHWVNLAYLLQTLLYYGLSLLAAHFWPAGLALAPVAALALVLALQAAILARAGLWRPLRPTAATLRDLLRLGRQSYLLALPVAALPPLAALLVFARAPDAAAFGVYDIAVRVATLAATLLSSIAVPMLAVAARVAATGTGTERLAGLVRNYLVIGWILYAVGMAFTALAGPRLLAWLFPAAGAGLFPVVLALLGGMGAIAACEAAARALLGTRHTAAVLTSRVLMLVVILGPGAWMLEHSGLAAFARVYLVAGMTAAVVTLLGWYGRRAVRPAVSAQSQ